jgi:hypothetical protein
VETKVKRGLTAVGIGLGGLLAGVVVATTLSAVAADDTPGTSANQGDPSQPQRSDEELLTGTTADKVQAAALAKYPGATVVRVETDSDGVYEAHLMKADGTPVTVEVNKSYEITGEEAGGFGHGHGGPPPGFALGDEDDDTADS